jgi:hypothetical protein
MTPDAGRIEMLSLTGRGEGWDGADAKFELLAAMLLKKKIFLQRRLIKARMT